MAKTRGGTLTSGTKTGLRNRPAKLLLACIGLLAAALPAEAQTTYVSNIGQTPASSGGLVGVDPITLSFARPEKYSLAQWFRTGKAVADTLGSVELHLGGFGRTEEARVSIYTSTGTPGRSLYVLTNPDPSEFVSNGLNTFSSGYPNLGMAA